MFLSSCSNLHHRISCVFKAALPEGPELHQHLMMVCRLVFSLQRFYRLSESFNYIILPYIYFWKALSLFWEEFCSTVLSVCSQRAQLSLKGNGCTKALIFIMFFLQYDDASLLLHHRDIAGNHIEKIQSVLYSSLYVLSYDILLNMVSWNFFSRSTFILSANDEGQGEILNQPSFSCRQRFIMLLFEVWRWSVKNCG